MKNKNNNSKQKEKNQNRNCPSAKEVNEKEEKKVEEVVEKLKGELATKDFVRAEINQVRTEIAEVSNKFNILEQKVKFYAIGLGFLMVILQPKVFEFITALFK